jgi:hypothetical protein
MSLYFQDDGRRTSAVDSYGRVFTDSVCPEGYRVVSGGGYAVVHGDNADEGPTANFPLIASYPFPWPSTSNVRVWRMFFAAPATQDDSHPSLVDVHTFCIYTDA